jgi:hypothetical protein
MTVRYTIEQFVYELDSRSKPEKKMQAELILP